MTPRLTIGLPVYNGEAYLEDALDALLGQSFADFELVISDNASTDATEELCRRRAAVDDRIRYIRQEHNLGASGNHNVVAYAAAGEYFKWASHDDLYAPDLLRLCVEALDGDDAAVASHSWTAMIDAEARIQHRFRYTLATDAPEAATRFRSLLFDVGGDDAYAVIRTPVLRQVLPYASYYRADRVFTAALALHGPFHQVRDWLYFRRDHPGRATRTPSVRSWCATADPRRADRLRHPLPRLLGEYIGGYVAAIRSAPLTAAERAACYRQLSSWLGNRAHPRHFRRAAEPNPESVPLPVQADDSLPAESREDA